MTNTAINSSLFPAVSFLPLVAIANSAYKPEQAWKIAKHFGWTDDECDSVFRLTALRIPKLNLPGESSGRQFRSLVRKHAPHLGKSLCLMPRHHRYGSDEEKSLLCCGDYMRLCLCRPSNPTLELAQSDEYVRQALFGRASCPRCKNFCLCPCHNFDGLDKFDTCEDCGPLDDECKTLLTIRNFDRLIGRKITMPNPLIEHAIAV